MKKVHKFDWVKKWTAQIYRCTGKRATGAEDVAWQWDKVTCKKCLGG